MLKERKRFPQDSEVLHVLFKHVTSTKKKNGINLDMTSIQVNLLELLKIPKQRFHLYT